MNFNLFGGLLPLRPRDALDDVLAGLTLASMNIPQVLGYTRIAGTPVVTGLYTVLLPLIHRLRDFRLFAPSRPCRPIPRQRRSFPARFPARCRSPVRNMWR